jgi:hypothetical protein
VRPPCRRCSWARCSRCSSSRCRATSSRITDSSWGRSRGVATALVTGRILHLSLALTAAAAAISGIAAALVGQALEHFISLPVAIGVFAACCAAYEANYGEPRSIDERA